MWRVAACMGCGGLARAPSCVCLCTRLCCPASARVWLCSAVCGGRCPGRSVWAKRRLCCCAVCCRRPMHGAGCSAKRPLAAPLAQTCTPPPSPCPTLRALRRTSTPFPPSLTQAKRSSSLSSPINSPSLALNPSPRLPIATCGRQRYRRVCRLCWVHAAAPPLQHARGRATRRLDSQPCPADLNGANQRRRALHPP